MKICRVSKLSILITNSLLFFYPTKFKISLCKMNTIWILIQYEYMHFRMQRALIAQIVILNTLQCFWIVIHTLLIMYFNLQFYIHFTYSIFVYLQIVFYITQPISNFRYLKCAIFTVWFSSINLNNHSYLLMLIKKWKPHRSLFLIKLNTTGKHLDTICQTSLQLHTVSYVEEII